MYFYLHSFGCLRNIAAFRTALHKSLDFLFNAVNDSPWTLIRHCSSIWHDYSTVVELTRYVFISHIIVLKVIVSTNRTLNRATRITIDVLAIYNSVRKYSWPINDQLFDTSGNKSKHHIIYN